MDLAKKPNNHLIFFSLPVLLTLAVYIINNTYLKVHYHSWFVGKLSDITFCFFFPLYLSSILVLLLRIRFTVSLYIGSAITLVGFSLVKLNHTASDLLNAVVPPLFAKINIPIQANIVDSTDLIALPFILIAFLFGKHKGDTPHE
jgi:hypothetical protein